MNNFANLLKEARKSAGLTQKELADRVGVNHSYVSKIERAVYDPPARDKVLAMADILGIEDRAQRAHFLLTAGCAGLDDLEEVAGEPNPHPFAAGAFNFPDTSTIETEALLARVRHLLNNPDMPPDERREMMKTLRSFVAWLEFRVAGEHE